LGSKARIDYEYDYDDEYEEESITSTVRQANLGEEEAAM
jgi:hypothetical protein